MPVAKREQRKGTYHVSKMSRASTASCVPKLQLRDPSLNVGVGAGALFMLINCQEEMKKLYKTVEETESLVQELKQALQRHGEDLESHHGHSVEDKFCPRESSCTDKKCTGQQPILTRNCRMDGLLEERVPAMGGMVKDQMAALAAELEAELELMELNMKTEESLPFDAGEVSSKGGSNSYYSDTSSHGMLEGSGIGRPSAQLAASQMDYGVSAIELDRRLREVLEAQQEDRILELEQLLEETKAKLLAKEQEIFCWKNHVHSLTNLLQPHSKVTESNVELLQSFQDPPISTGVNYLDATSSSDLVADIYVHEMTSPRSNRASLSAPPLFQSPLDAMNTMGESMYWQEGAGIDIPDYVIMKEIETGTEGKNYEVLERKIATSFVNVEGDDAASEPEITRLHCYVHDSDTPGRTELEISRLHDMNIENISFFPKAELDMRSDVKHIVNSIMPRRTLLDKYHENSSQEAQVPERYSKSRKNNQQLITKGWEESRGKPVAVTSPVLEKIRHFESLGGHAREKHEVTADVTQGHLTGDMRQSSTSSTWMRHSDHF
ncbi:hypothetical protein GOP47_0028068 [Adiantum capillus-veneris]|nr:hypothetical protein GOP47_0028068 [Adiantum capillus-veneris]